MMEKNCKLKLRKYEVPFFIIPESVQSHNSHTVGECQYCNHLIRANQWSIHISKCKKYQKHELNQNQTQKNKNNESVNIENAELIKEIIKIIQSTLESLLPAFLKEQYTQNTYWDKALLISRITPACQKLVSLLSSPFQDGISIQDIQKLIPATYHINISSIIDNVTDLQNYVFISDKVDNLHASQSTKVKYIKALNLLSNKFNLGWKIPIVNHQFVSSTLKSNQKSNQNPPKEVSNVGLSKKKAEKSISNGLGSFYDSDSSQSSQQFSDESDLDIIIPQPQSQSQLELKPHSQIIGHLFKKEKESIKLKSNLKSLQKVTTKRIDNFAWHLKKIQSTWRTKSVLDIKSLSSLIQKKPYYSSPQLLENILKKCQICCLWVQDDFWKCLICCSFYCLECVEKLKYLCQCQNKNYNIHMIQDSQIWDNFNQVALSNIYVFHPATNCLSNTQIRQFETKLSKILKTDYQYTYVRSAVFYNKIGQTDYCYNLLYDPLVMKASKSVQAIHEKYQKGLYYPPIKIIKNEKGYCVYSKRQMKSRTFLFEYAADVLPCCVSLGKGNKIMKLAWGPTSTSQLQLTARTHCGVGPLVNHSNVPNAKTIRLLIKGTLRVIFYSIKKIQENEEITYNYNGQSTEYDVGDFEDDIQVQSQVMSQIFIQ